MHIFYLLTYMRGYESSSEKSTYILRSISPPNTQQRISMSVDIAVGETSVSRQNNISRRYFERSRTPRFSNLGNLLHKGSAAIEE